MTDYNDALANMPHKGNMLLIESIEDADELHIQVLAKPHSSAQYPLRVNGELYSVALCEVGAQAAAAHASLFQMKGSHKGLLTALKSVKAERQTVPNTGQQLRVSAHKLHDDAGGSIYGFSIALGEDLILSGQSVLKIEGDRL